MQHPIARITATPLLVRSSMSWLGIDRTRTSSMCLVEVETKGGIVGHGLTGLSDGPTVAGIIEKLAAPALVGADAMLHERIAHTLYWTLTSAAQTGAACNAMSAIDLALWDIKGKALGLPIWKLLGGARDRLELYVTLGMPSLAPEEMATMARSAVAQGYRALKIQVGRPGIDERGGARRLGDLIAEDLARLEAMRAAIGDDIEIAIDGAARFDLPHAIELARRASDYRVAWYEEPIHQNDIRLMAELRRQTGIRVSVGQNEGLLMRFREMITGAAVDMIQPNVSIIGGFTGGMKAAALAAAFNMGVASGGGSNPFHNMHLIAGVENGRLLEYQGSASGAYEPLFVGLPRIEQGWVSLPDKPGLGFEPRKEGVQEFAVR